MTEQKPTSRPRAIPGAWEKPLLEALALHPVLGQACIAAGVERTAVWDRRQADSEFAAAYTAALEAGIDRVESMLVKRAEGINHNVYGKTGEIIGQRKEYSDYAAAKFLEARRPEFYYRPRKEIIREGEDPIAAMARAVCAAVAAGSASVPQATGTINGTKE